MLPGLLRVAHATVIVNKMNRVDWSEKVFRDQAREGCEVLTASGVDVAPGIIDNISAIDGMTAKGFARPIRRDFLDQMRYLDRLPRHYAVSVLLAVMVVAVFWQVGSFPFVQYDDDFYILNNPAVQGGLSPAGIRWAFQSDRDLWAPLTWFSRMADVSLFGMDAGKHHLVNLLFHLIDTLLLFHVFRRMTGKSWESGLVAALFAVHPLHVESVAWVTERKDVLSGFFWIVSLWAYARYSERPGIARYGAVVLFFVLGLMSKAILVTLPFVLLLLDFWPLGRLRPNTGGPFARTRFPAKSITRLLLEKAPLLLLSAAASVAALLGQRKIGAVSSLDSTSLANRAGNALHAYGFYLRKALWPSDLAVYYPHPGTALPLWNVAAALLVLCGITTVAALKLRSRPWLAVGWFWFLGTLVPVIGLVQIGGQGMADRYMYIPLIGLSIIAAWEMGELSARSKFFCRMTGTMAGIWFLALAICAWVQVGYWRGTIPLFTHALQVTSDNWMAYGALGRAATGAGRDNEAISDFREALRISPGVHEIHNLLAVSLKKVGKSGEAIEHFRTAIRLMPDFPEAHNNLGICMTELGRFEEAIVQFQEALRFQPENAEAHNNAGVCLWELGRYDEAIGHYRESLRILPGYADAHYNLGRALASRGAVGEGSFHLREAIRIRPDHAEAHNALGVLLAEQGAFPEAVSLFREALRIKPDYPNARSNLDRALSSRGREFDP